MADETSNLPPFKIAEKPAIESNRIASIDIYRGMVMFLMLAEALHLNHLHKHKEGFSPWIQGLFDWISFHTEHVEWRGCSLHDMIQPSFSFLVGTSMAYSILSRRSKGQSSLQLFLHAIFRSFILIFLGIFLRSLAHPITNFTFDDTLTQIGMGYTFLFLCASLPVRWIVGVIAGILVGYWALFVSHPMPSEDFPYTLFGVPNDWPEHFKGFQSHWNKNSNFASKFDLWWMNLFPRKDHFEFSAGGYCTLSFIPTLGTMLLGLLAGRILQSPTNEGRRLLSLMICALLCLGLAWLIDYVGLCPIVKRIWTPTWTLWSGGICFIWLIWLHVVSDLYRWKAWAFPFLVIGANSIVAYVMSWTMEAWTLAALRRHFGWLFERVVLPEDREFALPLLYGALTLLIFWLILFWLYRKKIFVRI